MRLPRISEIDLRRLGSPAATGEFPIPPPSPARLRFAQPPADAFRPSRKPPRAVSLLMTFVAATFGLCFWVMSRLSPELGWTTMNFSSPRGEGWSRQVASSSMSKDLRRLVVYRQTPQSVDWRMEFRWKSEPAGIGLIVRSSDARNYHAVRLRPAPDGFSEDSFEVVEGVEGRHSVKTIVFPNSDPEVPITMEETGPDVALYVRHEILDRWTENQLKADRIGFFEERGHKLTTSAIRISFGNRPSPRAILAAAIQTAHTFWSSFRFSTILTRYILPGTLPNDSVKM
jgi:hypothetical protein